MNEIKKKLIEDIKFRKQFGMIAESEIIHICGFINKAFKELKKQVKEE